MWHLKCDRLVADIGHANADMAAQASRAVNTSFTLRNWLIGFHIETPDDAIVVVGAVDRDAEDPCPRPARAKRGEVLGPAGGVGLESGVFSKGPQRNSAHNRGE